MELAKPPCTPEMVRAPYTCARSSLPEEEIYDKRCQSHANNYAHACNLDIVSPNCPRWTAGGGYLLRCMNWAPSLSLPLARYVPGCRSWAGLPTGCGRPT